MGKSRQIVHVMVKKNRVYLVLFNWDQLFDRCHPAVIEFLIKPDDDPNTKGAEIDAQDQQNLTALHVAVFAKCLQSVKLLVEKGSDVSLQVGTKQFGKLSIVTKSI